MRRAFVVLLIATGAAAAEPSAAVDATAVDAMVIEDPLPVIRRALASPRLDALVGVRGFAHSWAAQLDGAGPLIPRRLVLAGTADTWRGLGEAIRFGLDLGLVNGAEDADDGEALAALRADAMPRLARWSLPPLALAVDFRDDGGAGLAEAWIRAQLASAGFVAADDGAFTLDVADHLRPSGAEAIAVHFHLANAPGDPAAEAFSDALRGLRLRVTLRRSERALTLTTGAWEPPADLRALGGADAPLLWTRWDITAFAASARDTLTEWQRWESTPTGRATAEHDRSDLIAGLRRIVDRTEHAAKAATGTVTVGEDIVMTVDERAAPIGSPLATDPLLAALPPGAPVVAIDGSLTLADWLGGVMDRFEGKAGGHVLSLELVGAKAASADAERAISDYRVAFAQLRRLILDEHEVYFTLGVAQITDFAGMLPHLTLGATGVAPTELRCLPIPRLVLLGRERLPGSGSRFMRHLVVDGLGALYDHLGRPASGSADRAVDGRGRRDGRAPRARRSRRPDARRRDRER